MRSSGCRPLLTGGAGASVTLEPFYAMHGNRHYTVYWDVFTPSQWEVNEGRKGTPPSSLAAKELDNRTIHRVNPGEEQNECHHKLEGEKTGAGDFGNRKSAACRGRRLFPLRAQGTSPPAARAERDLLGLRGRGRRTFDILVDGKKLATERLTASRPEQFFDQVYPLPEDLTKGNSEVTVTFQAHPRQTAGGVFGIRVLSIKP